MHTYDYVIINVICQSPVNSGVPIRIPCTLFVIFEMFKIDLNTLTFIRSHEIIFNIIFPFVCYEPYGRTRTPN